MDDAQYTYNYYRDGDDMMNTMIRRSMMKRMQKFFYLLTEVFIARANWSISKALELPKIGKQKKQNFSKQKIH